MVKVITIFTLWEYMEKVIPIFTLWGYKKKVIPEEDMLTWVFSIITSFIHMNSKCNVWSSWEYIYVETGQETELSELILRNRLIG
jgi:hypothetical protein